MLVENVARDPYIRSATIFAEDGQVVVQHPKPLDSVLSSEQPAEKINVLNKNTSDLPDNHSSNAINLETKTRNYIQSENDIPFIEKITYQNVTAGWLKIALNRQLLESSFRSSLKTSLNIILFIATFLTCIILYITFRYEKQVKKIIASCHHLITVKADKLPKNREEWINSFTSIAKQPVQTIDSQSPQPLKALNWHQSRRAEETIFCYFKFSMSDQDNEQTPYVLSMAENYLLSAVRTYGLQPQGNILSGSLIPFLNTTSSKEAVQEAINLTQLLKELLASLPLPIAMRAFIGKGTVLILENERSMITGISLSNRLLHKIHLLEAVVAEDDITCIGIESDELNDTGTLEAVTEHNIKVSLPLFKITAINEMIKQQVNRKVSYLHNELKITGENPQ